MTDPKHDAPQELKLMIQLRPAVLDAQHAAAYLSLSAPTLERMSREGGFPRPRQLSGKRVGYLLRELDDWLDQRPPSQQLPPPNSGYGRAGKPA
jgi:prophage regulatory protein